LNKVKNIYLFYFIIACYLALNVYSLVFSMNMFYSLSLLPFVILVILLAFFNIETLMYFMVFSTPLAISLKELNISEGLNLSLPSEPIMIGVTFIYFINELTSGVTDKRILKHPITIIIFIQVIWIVITSFTSQLPIISLKFLLSRLWFLTSCYFMMTVLFKNKRAMINVLLIYSISLAIVCIITTIKHSTYGFDEKTADWIVSPFYNDHTAYGAALAMYIPLMFGFLFMSNISKLFKVVCFLILAIFLISIIVSYARAGWLSLVVAILVLFTLFLKLNFKAILLTIVTLVFISVSFQSEILRVVGKNNTDSDGDFFENIKSMSNISTDVSNLERLNRWNSALQMFKEKPVFGFGPGTYQFKYASYQKSNLKTIISTNFGDKGNAHSEYLGPLCEQGFFGALIILILVFASMNLGYRLVYTVKDKSIRIMVICITLGLSTYFVHGFLNNFLDTDKASVSFWGFLAMLVCIDIYFKDEPSLENVKDE